MDEGGEKQQQKLWRAGVLYPGSMGKALVTQEFGTELLGDPCSDSSSRKEGEVCTHEFPLLGVAF